MADEPARGAAPRPAPRPKRFDTLKLGEWAAFGLHWLGFALPAMAVLICIGVGYWVAWRAGGLWLCGLVLVVQALAWFVPRPEIRDHEKLERKMWVFYRAKGLFAATLLGLFLVAPPYAGFALGDWTPAAWVYGSAFAAIALGTALMNVAKTITDRFSNYPYH